VHKCQYGYLRKKLRRNKLVGNVNINDYQHDQANYAEVFNIRLIVMYGYEYFGTRNQESPCWREPTSIQESVRWTYHLDRLKKERVANQILRYKPKGQRDWGRPWKRWDVYIKTEGDL
jgi:hypothetical protein